MLWWLAAAAFVPVVVGTAAAFAGLGRGLGLAVMLVLTAPVIAASLWVVCVKDVCRGQLTVSGDAIVLDRPFGRTLRLKRPVSSVQYIQWKDDDALGIGIIGNVGMTAVLSGVGDKIRIGGKGIHSVPGIAPIARQIHTAPGAALDKNDFHRVLAILKEDGTPSPQEST